MRHVVSSKLLNEESFGSTPGKMAASALLQKTLAMDQLRIESRVGGLFDCDTSGCYDRILPPLALVHLQALGLNRSSGTFLARLMYQAKRHVKTGTCISLQSIATKKKRVLHGIGQGNGGGQQCGSHIWQLCLRHYPQYALDLFLTVYKIFVL